MRSRLSALLLTLVVAACASTSNDGGTMTDAGGTGPQVTVTQISNVASAARHQTGPVPVQYRINVVNRGAAPITLTRVAIQSLGEGAYNVSQSSSFDARIEPAESRDVEMWAPANVAQSTILGANGPVTIRATLQFNAESGKFQTVVTQQVSGMQAGGN
jgi:hypothetical protein